MTTMRGIAYDELDALALGAGILGTGGGTHPYLELLNIKRLYQEGRRVRLLDPSDLDDDEIVAEVGFMGAPLVSKERLPDPAQICKAFLLMEHHTGRSFDAVMSSEVGGENGVLPLVVAAIMNIPLLDADPRGRALPEMQMSSFAIAGIPLFPIALADIRNNEMLLVRTANPKWTERLGRTLCTETGAMLATCRTPRTGRQVKEHAVLGSISRAIRLGKAVLEARPGHRHPGEAVLAVEPGLRVFDGKVVDVARRTTAGFVRGHTRIEGRNSDAGSLFEVDFQNEFSIGWLDGRLHVMVPDLICILDAESGEAIGTETIRYGMRVAVISIPAAPMLKTHQALEVVGPRAFGYDLEFFSLHADTEQKAAP